MNVVKILGSTLTSNIIAFLSLIVSIISMVITAKTMQSAKVIQDEVRRNEIDAINKYKFLEIKPQLINKIDKSINLLQEEYVCTKELYMELVSSVTEISIKCDNVFTDKDNNKIEEIYRQIKERKSGTNKKGYSKADVEYFLEALITVKAILEKGEYVA